MRSRGEGVAEAVKLFEAAIARDSTWAPAWAGLAESQALMPYYDQVANDSASWAANLGAAEVAARNALVLDPDNASALVALANVYKERWQWEDAEEAYRRALAADPDNVEAHQQYAEYLSYVGREREAYHVAKRALALDRAPIRLNAAGYLAQYGGRMEEGIALLEEGIRLDPECGVRMLRTNVRWGYLALGRWADLWETYLQEYPRCFDWEPGDEFDELLAVWPAPGPPPANLDVANLPFFGPLSKARIAAHLGQYEVALEQLADGWSDQPPYGPSESLFDRVYDPIRDDPRFQALLARRGLEGIVPDRLPPDPASAP
jgi:tetratricopeptide (TPR) repeat protein